MMVLVPVETEVIVLLPEVIVVVPTGQVVVVKVIVLVVIISGTVVEGNVVGAKLTAGTEEDPLGTETTPERGGTMLEPGVVRAVVGRTPVGMEETTGTVVVPETTGTLGVLETTGTLGELV